MYHRLLAAYGPQGWWPGSGDPFEIVVGAILVQSVSWKNVVQALANLEAAGALSPSALLALDHAQLASLIRPSGYYTVKARRLRAVAQMIVADFEADLGRLLALPLPELRAKLLATYGIGQETADDIILYAAGKPSFVVDAYTVRLFTRLGLSPSGPSEAASPTTTLDSRRYTTWYRYFMERLPADAALFNEYHALIVRHGVVRCRKRDPRCAGCPLLDLCPAASPPLPEGAGVGGEGS